MIVAQQKLVPALRFPEFTGEWEDKQIGSICEIKTGDKDTKNKVSDGNYPFFVRSDNVERIDTYSYDGEAILTSGDGVGVGKNFHYYKGKFDFHQRVYCLRNFKQSVSGRFIYEIFSERFFRRVIRLSAKNSVDSVRIEMIAKMEIASPSIEEQQKIAAFLSSVDTKIEQLSKKKSLLEQYKQGMMQKLFSQEIQFKDKQGEDYPDWEEKKICEAFNIKRGNVLAANQLKPSLENDHIYPVFSSQTKNNGLMGYYTDYLYESAITWTTDGANAGEVKYRDGKFYCTNVCGVLLSEAGFANQCISEMLNEVTRKYVSYVGNPKLMNNVMATIKIYFPSVSEQSKISKFLSAIDRKIELVSEQIKQTQTFKKGLLQQMFV